MYQTRGLFYPSLSQRVYQSNQSLKLAAKAGCHPKGEFIRLKSFRLPNDSNIDMKHNRHCFLLAPSPPVFLLTLGADLASSGRGAARAGACPALLGLPTSRRRRRLGAAVRSGLWRHAARPRMRADRTCPCQLHPCLRQFKRVR